MLPAAEEIIEELISLKMAPLWTLCCLLLWTLIATFAVVCGDLLYALSWVPIAVFMSAAVVDMWHRRITGRRLIKF